MDLLQELLLDMLLELLLVLLLLLSIRRFSDGVSDRAARFRPRPGCVRLPRAPCCVRLAKKYALCWLAALRSGSVFSLELGR